MPPSPVIWWIELGGKPKWLPLNSEYHDIMLTSPLYSTRVILELGNGYLGGGGGGGRGEGGQACTHRKIAEMLKDIECFIACERDTSIGMR